MKLTLPTTALSHPLYQTTLLGGLCLAVGLGVALPTWLSTTSNRAEIKAAEQELYALRKLAGQTVALENKLQAGDVATTEKQSLLKQVESLSREAQVFSAISQITPITTEGGGQALSLSFDDISFAEWLPFLEKIENTPALAIQTLELRRAGRAEGRLSVRLVVQNVF